MEIFEEEVPLAAVPATGDNSTIWMVGMILSLIALMGAAVEEIKARRA